MKKFIDELIGSKIYVVEEEKQEINDYSWYYNGKYIVKEHTICGILAKKDSYEVICDGIKFDSRQVAFSPDEAIDLWENTRIDLINAELESFNARLISTHETADELRQSIILEGKGGIKE